MKIFISINDSAIVFHTGQDAYYSNNYSDGWQEIEWNDDRELKGEEGFEYWTELVKNEGKNPPFWIEVEDLTIEAIFKAIPELQL